MTATINKINNVHGLMDAKGTKQFTIEIKMGDEIIYQGVSKAGVVNIVEDIFNVDDDAVIEGNTQSFIYGNPFVVYFSFDQLKNHMGGKVLHMLKTAFERLGSDPKRVRDNIFSNIDNILYKKN